MRTNTLLLTVALGVASAATSMAQVYSVNSVGYINIPIKTGFNLIANQLVQANQTIEVLLAGAPNQAAVYKFTPGTGPSAGYDTIVNDLDLAGGWDSGNAGSLKGLTTLDNGGGVFYYNPEAEFTLTLVGEVAQGALSTPIVPGFQIISSRVPQAGLFETALGFVAVNQDTVYKFINTGNPATSGYVTYINDLDLAGGWDFGGPALQEPSLGVGEAIFFFTPGAHAAWNRTFTVN